MLDESHELKFIEAADYQRYRAGYEALADFRPGQSPRLNTFRHAALQMDQAIPESLGRTGAYKPPSQRGAASIELLAGEMTPARALRMTGYAATAVDAYRTARRVQTLLEQDNLLGAKHEVRDAVANNANAWAMGLEVGKLSAELGARR